ncbi:MAG TPA: enoyl-CoA hydratase/isomerase family protein [Aestuariivirgaceae bacterium]|nr:enoyl-CoA hydratase/isomerase family protein [Aestuariivirgaceae bacterium]
MDRIVNIERLGEIAVVRFDRRGRANALSFAMMEDLAAAARSFETDAAVRVVVLAGAPKIFSAGMDLADPAFARIAAMSFAERRMLAEHGPRLTRAWAGVEAPTIAAIEGPCLAGGLALAAMCDFRVGAQGARFGAPEIEVAHNMGWHTVPRLVAILGVQAARRILMTGEQWSVEEARSAGLVDWTAAEGKALDRALEVARHIARYPAVAARMIKRQIEAAAHGFDWAVSALDKDQQVAVWLSEEFEAARRRFSDKG